MKHNKVIVEDNEYTLYSSKDNVNWECVDKFGNLYEVEKYLKGNDFSVEYFAVNYYYDWGIVGPGNITTITNLILPRGSLRPETYSLIISGNEGKHFTLYFDKYDKVESIYNKLKEVLEK